MFCGNEHWLRSKHVRSTLYQCLATSSSRSDVFCCGFARLTVYYHRIEVPRSCFVYLPLVFTYLMWEICETISPLLVVAYSELAAKTADFILFVIYDFFRMWALGNDSIYHASQLEEDLAISKEHTYVCFASHYN